MVGSICGWPKSLIWKTSSFRGFSFRFRCPPGHGDIYPSLLGSGMLDSLRAEGVKYLFVSNSDNLGATLSLNLLTYFASSGKDFLMEVSCMFQSLPCLSVSTCLPKMSANTAEAAYAWHGGIIRLPALHGRSASAANLTRRAATWPSANRMASSSSASQQCAPRRTRTTLRISHYTNFSTQTTCGSTWTHWLTHWRSVISQAALPLLNTPSMHQNEAARVAFESLVGHCTHSLRR